MSEIFRRLPALGAMLISSALLICFSAGRTQAATSGPNNPSSASGTNWVNPTGIFAVDSASASYNNTTQDYLFVTGFGFSVSTHAVVQGISVSRKGSSLGTTAARRQYQMALTKNGTALVGTAKTGLALPQTTDDTVVVGSTSDVWGTTWTGAEVSSPSFGVMLRDNDTTAFQISFDNVNVTITYTPPEPQSVSISSTSTTSIQATWTNATTPEQGFTFEASTDVFPNSYTGNKSSTTVSTANTSLTISALQANTTYFTRVGSRWTDGTTTYASAVTTATLAVPVTTTQIYQAFLNSVTVNWQALPASPSTSTCEGYRLQASTASDFSGTLISSQTSSVALSTLTVTGLAAGTTYYFRVGSLNWYGGANYINAGSTMTLSGWSLSKVDYPTNLSNATAMALDSLGRPEIVYYEVSNFKMKFAQWTGTSWSTQTVNANNDAGSFSSIVIDPSDYPHTSFQYHDPSFLNLNYAEYNGSIWSTTTIDSAGDVGWYTSIARDGAGNLHISYYSNTAHDLKYAKWNGTRWSTQTIDSAGDVGAYSSLVVDSTGNP